MNLRRKLDRLEEQNRCSRRARGDGTKLAVMLEGGEKFDLGTLACSARGAKPANPIVVYLEEAAPATGGAR